MRWGQVTLKYFFDRQIEAEWIIKRTSLFRRTASACEYFAASKRADPPPPEAAICLGMRSTA
jgi:hypothetical protein